MKTLQEIISTLFIENTNVYGLRYSTKLDFNRKNRFRPVFHGIRLTSIRSESELLASELFHSLISKRCYCTRLVNFVFDFVAVCLHCWRTLPGSTRLGGARARGSIPSQRENQRSPTSGRRDFVLFDSIAESTQ